MTPFDEIMSLLQRALMLAAQHGLWIEIKITTRPRE